MAVGPNRETANARLPPGMVSLAPIMKPSPELSAAIAREAPSIHAAALLRNSRQTDARGEQQARAIADRIHASLHGQVSRQVVLLHVNFAVAGEQMTAAFGKGGPVMAVLRAEAPRSSKPFADVLNKLGSVDIKALIAAFRKAYGGQEPAEAARHLRAEFDRSEALYRLQGLESADRSPLHAGALTASNNLLDMVITLLQRHPTNSELNRLGYEMAVAYKARSPEIERRISASLSEANDAEARSALAEWRAAREGVASRELQLAAGVAFDERERSELSRARAAEGQLTERLSKLAMRGRTRDKPFVAETGVQQLKAGLGPDDAVVSFVEYRQVTPDDATAHVPGRGAHCAFVLTPAGVSFVDLGSSDSLQQRIDSFLRTVGSAAASVEQKRASSNELYQRLFAPLEPALSRAVKIQIVPDGASQLLPFDALYDGRAWLADRYQLSYAFSERQLLGEHAPAVDFGPPLVLVPTYSKLPTLFHQGQKLIPENFPALDGAEAEGRHVQALLKGARLVVGRQATEGALSAGRPPRVLHIAGHGVMLPLNASSGADDRGLVLSKSNGVATSPSRDVDPMALSALVLAPSPQDKSDGFLTAYEVTTVPLWGTALVVLSACESGRGSPDRVKGVQGLRRAFFTAGAESLVTSLWSVSDDSTDALMSAFYANLEQGLGRGESLRKASAVLRAKTQDPFFWAPFVLLGDVTPLSLSTAPLHAPTGEDPESRLQRAMVRKRLTHASTRMGVAHWTSPGGESQALDAYVSRRLPPERAPLLFTLLGKTESVSLLVRDYPGPGTYSMSRNQLVASTSPVADPLAVDIRKLDPEAGSVQASDGTLEITDDSVARGFNGRFTLQLRDGRKLSGDFRLESSLPAIPAAMQPSPRAWPVGSRPHPGVSD